MNTAFPFRCFAVEVGHAKPHASHVHDANEFFVCRNSVGQQFTRNTGTWQRRGDIFCFPSGMPHYCSGTANGKAAGYVIMLPDLMFATGSYGDRDTHQTVRRIVDLAKMGGNPLPVTGATSSRILALCSQMVGEAAARRHGHEAATRILLQEMFLLIMRDRSLGTNFQANAGLMRHEEQMARVRWFLDTHFMESVTVGQTAATAGLSRSHFHTVFREATGCTLIDYVTRLRIMAAQRMLRESNLKVTEIAMSCGFSTMSRFYDAFKRIIGTTPGAVRSSVL